jgi:hypothetical protein
MKGTADSQVSVTLLDHLTLVAQVIADELVQGSRVVVIQIDVEPPVPALAVLGELVLRVVVFIVIQVRQWIAGIWVAQFERIAYQPDQAKVLPDRPRSCHMSPRLALMRSAALVCSGGTCLLSQYWPSTRRSSTALTIQPHPF